MGAARSGTNLRGLENIHNGAGNDGQDVDSGQD